MFKSELIKRIEIKKQFNPGVIRIYLDAIIDEIKTALLNGEDVSIPGFGVFKVRDVAARKGINPRTGEEIQIPAMKRVHFTSGKAFREALNK